MIAEYFQGESGGGVAVSYFFIDRLCRGRRWIGRLSGYEEIMYLGNESSAQEKYDWLFS